MSLTRKDYQRAQRQGVQYAHKATDSLPIIEDASTAAEKDQRMLIYIRSWGSALEGYKAGYRDALREMQK